jgi:hypothetical protein
MVMPPLASMKLNVLVLDHAGARDARVRQQPAALLLAEHGLPDPAPQPLSAQAIECRAHRHAGSFTVI